MSQEHREREKELAGRSAAAAVEDGDVVGLGTGSTAAHAIEALGERVDEEGLAIRGIPTSHQSRHRAMEAGIPLTSLHRATPDVAIDGADQVGDALDLIKGGGAAHARERVVAHAADRFAVVVDGSKRASDGALDEPVPLEVLGFAVPVVEDAVRALGGEPALRMAARKDGPVVTDNDNLVVDADLGRIDEPATVAGELDAVPGLVAHGLFVGMADEVHVGDGDDVEVLTPE